MYCHWLLLFLLLFITSEIIGLGQQMILRCPHQQYQAHFLPRELTFALFEKRSFEASLFGHVTVQQQAPAVNMTLTAAAAACDNDDVT